MFCDTILCHHSFIRNYSVNTLRPRQNGHLFADDIFKCFFLNENIWILVKIWLNFFPKVRINNIPALVQITLGTNKAKGHYLNHQWWFDYRHIYVSLGLNELKNKSKILSRLFQDLFLIVCYSQIHLSQNVSLTISGFNSLAPGGCEYDPKSVIFNHVLLIGIFRFSHDNALRWMPQDLTDDKSTLVQVMAWYRQATSHYLLTQFLVALWRRQATMSKISYQNNFGI